MACVALLLLINNQYFIVFLAINFEVPFSSQPRFSYN